eukprot:1485668-Prymnesium_polylepis.1
MSAILRKAVLRMVWFCTAAAREKRRTHGARRSIGCERPQGAANGATGLQTAQEACGKAARICQGCANLPRLREFAKAAQRQRGAEAARGRGSARAH